MFCLFFFFQAEDGIRDWSVTGVQTCALPIWRSGSDSRNDCAQIPPDKFPCPRQREYRSGWRAAKSSLSPPWRWPFRRPTRQIGRASCRERAESSGGTVSSQEKKEENNERRTK